MKRLATLILVVLVLIFILLIVIIIRNSQSYSTSRKVIDQKEYSIVDNKTTEEVEQENLAKLVSKNPAETINRYKYSDSEISNLDDKLTSLNYYKLNPDSTVLGSEEKVSLTRTIAAIYADTKITDQKDLVKNLKSLISQDKFLNIELDKNLEQYLPDFLGFLKELSTFAKANNIKITYSTYPYWGNSVSYSYFYNYSPLYANHINVSLINDYVDYIRIHTYNYTNSKSVLAGPISPLDWVENTIRFFILSNVDSKKIQIVINTKGLLWGYVDFAKDFKNNFLDSEDNAIIQTPTQVAELLKQKVNSQINFDSDEILYNLANGKTLVSPTSNTYSRIENLAKDYSLDGIVYK